MPAASMTTSGPAPPARILLVEDDRQTRELVASVLTETGYTVAAVGRGAAATAQLEEGRFSAIILDVGLPDGNGVDLCRAWRKAGVSLPVLMLTARTDVGSRVAGLDGGADDYLGKPFAVAELRARVRALLRRGEHPLQETVFRRGDLVVDFGRRMATRRGAELPVTRRELEVFERIVRARGIAVSRDDLLEEIWGESTPEAGSSLEVIIGRLRKKLDAPGSERLIRTMRGYGYALSRADDGGER